jgi:hypothetical protein
MSTHILRQLLIITVPQQFHIVIPTIILTYLSFGVFLLDLRMGERLSYGMALTLVIVASSIVTGDLLPVSNEKLWISQFVGLSFYWVVFGLIESVALAYVYFIREDENGKTSAKQQQEEGIPQGDTNTPLSELESTTKQAAQETVQQPVSRRNFIHSYPLRRVDHFCFLLATTTYTIFIIAMFASVPRWGSGIKDVYFHADDGA